MKQVIEVIEPVYFECKHCPFGGRTVAMRGEDESDVRARAVDHAAAHEAKQPGHTVAVEGEVPDYRVSSGIGTWIKDPRSVEIRR